MSILDGKNEKRMQFIEYVTIKIKKNHQRKQKSGLKNGGVGISTYSVNKEHDLSGKTETGINTI